MVQWLRRSQDSDEVTVRLRSRVAERRVNSQPHTCCERFNLSPLIDVQIIYPAIFHNTPRVKSAHKDKPSARKRLGSVAESRCRLLLSVVVHWHCPCLGCVVVEPELVGGVNCGGYDNFTTKNCQKRCTIARARECRSRVPRTCSRPIGCGSHHAAASAAAAVACCCYC